MASGLRASYGIRGEADGQRRLPTPALAASAASFPFHALILSVYCFCLLRSRTAFFIRAPNNPGTATSIPTHCDVRNSRRRLSTRLLVQCRSQLQDSGAPGSSFAPALLVFAAWASFLDQGLCNLGACDCDSSLSPSYHSSTKQHAAQAQGQDQQEGEGCQGVVSRVCSCPPLGQTDSPRESAPSRRRGAPL